MQRASAIWSGRISLFVIYAWFGILKMVDISPAEGLVNALFVEIFQSGWQNFLFLFGAIEVIIGTAFLVVGPRRWVIRLFLLHIFATLLPLVLLPSITWSGVLVPTLIGQYIIKNLALLSVVKFLQIEETA